MATQAQRPTTHPEKRTASRRSRNGRTTRRRNTTQRSTRSVAELEKVIRGLEARIADLTSDRTIRSTVRGATGQANEAINRVSDQFGEMLADSLVDIAGRVGGSAASVTGAARVGTSAIQKIGMEIEKRPLMTVAIALGIGFLAAMTNRRQAA